MPKVVSYQVADGIDIRFVKKIFEAELYYSDADELFYKTGNHRFIYVFKYGVVCFLNYDEASTKDFLKIISPCCKNFFSESLSEEYLIETGAPEIKVGYNKIEVAKENIEVLRLIM